ncbi:MAG: chromate resistance protein ChrB domain-containing protein, partial [Bacteroidales bacterium]
WLIRRFIDPAARFAFAEQSPASSKAVPFDMYDVDFSHHADLCTFEVLCQRFGIKDPAVTRLGRLVHDLDLKESRYNVPEAAAVGLLIDGLRQTYSRDDELLEHGVVLFEALYRALRAGRLDRRHPSESAWIGDRTCMQGN